ncbi:MAG: hypothetical protein HFG08_07190 [Oscillibacter sp.]|nr:hypothetical protein [Oscillibacter sp.]
MKNRKVKLFFLAIGVLILIVVWLSTYGMNKTIDRTISVDVYEDDDWSSIASSIEISGNLKKTLFSTNFVGTFAIEYYEPTCRDGVQAKIDWQDGYQNISFYYAGDFSRFDVKMIDINEDMNHMMMILEDGTIITSPDYDIPTQIWKAYKE